MNHLKKIFRKVQEFLNLSLPDKIMEIRAKISASDNKKTDSGNKFLLPSGEEKWIRNTVAVDFYSAPVRIQRKSL